MSRKIKLAFYELELKKKIHVFEKKKLNEMCTRKKYALPILSPFRLAIQFSLRLSENES